MKKEILLVLLDEFADWEGAFIAPLLNMGIEPGREKFIVKVLSLTKDPVKSIGGIRVLPDYDVDSVPQDHAGLILIGGMTWFDPRTRLLDPIVRKAFEDGKLVAGICNASVYLGMLGILNNLNHTSNTLDYLKGYAGAEYNGDAHYIEKQAVRDGVTVTANGSAYLEFCREILYALQADEDDKIEGAYNFYKNGLCTV